jgi:hypothetical protein
MSWLFVVLSTNLVKNIGIELFESPVQSFVSFFTLHLIGNIKLVSRDAFSAHKQR